MRTHFKNEKGRMGFDIPEIKTKREINGKRKGGFAGNGVADFKKFCVMWVLKKFFHPVGKR